MGHPIKKLALVAVAVFILLVVLVAAFHHSVPTVMARLQFNGYMTNGTQAKVAILVLTNPGPAQVDYSTIQERSGTNSFIGHGTLAGGSIITYHIVLSHHPTRLLISCAPRHQLKELAEEAESFLGMKTSPRSSDYTLFSEELTK